MSHRDPATQAKPSGERPGGILTLLPEAIVGRDELCESETLQVGIGGLVELVPPRTRPSDPGDSPRAA